MRRLIALPVSLAADATYAASLWLDTLHNVLTGAGQQGLEHPPVPDFRDSARENLDTGVWTMRDAAIAFATTEEQAEAYLARVGAR